MPEFAGVRILDDEFFDSVGFGDFWNPSFHAEFIGNTIHGGGQHRRYLAQRAAALRKHCGQHAVAGTLASRFLINAPRHCATRFNEVHDYQRSIWANAEERFLVHGDFSKSGGRPTGLSPMAG